MLNWVSAAVLSAASFTVIDDVNGVRIESRDVAGSEFSELRLTTLVTVPVPALCDAAFGDGGVPSGDPYLLSRKVLVERPDERITYEQIAAPLISRRDYALRTRRTAQTDGRCDVSFELDNAYAPPVPKGWVRLKRLQGGWHFETRGNRTLVTYTSHDEPGGDVPALFAERPRRTVALEIVRRLLARVGPGDPRPR